MADLPRLVISDDDMESGQPIAYYLVGFTGAERTHVRRCIPDATRPAPFGYAMAVEKGKAGDQIMVVLKTSRQVFGDEART